MQGMSALRVSEDEGRLIATVLMIEEKLNGFHQASMAYEIVVHVLAVEEWTPSGRSIDAA
jgi:hypothetical protein